MKNLARYIPPVLILSVCVLLARFIPHLGNTLMRSMEVAGGELPMLTRVVVGAIQNGLMFVIVLGYGVLSAIVLALLGKKESSITYQSLLCNFLWMGIVFYLVAVMFAFYLPFVFMGFSVN